MKTIVNGIIVFVGLLLFIGPLTFLGPCNMDAVACIYLAKATSAIGVIVAASGAAGFFAGDKKSTLAFGLLQLIEGIVVLSISDIIGYCDMMTMPCRVKTVPGIRIAGVVIVVAALVLLVATFIQNRKEKNVF